MFITMIQAIIYAVKYLREILLNRLIKGLYHWRPPIRVPVGLWRERETEVRERAAEEEG